MPAGFFSQSVLASSKAPVSRVPQCGACGLLKTCKSPKMPVSGKGRRKILIIGEAPGENEDIQNKQFVGKTGRFLEQTLAKYDIDMRRDCWLTNSLICRPPKNAKPSDSQISYCRPNLINTVNELKPEIIVPLGEGAVQSLIGHLWKEDVGAIGRWIGWQIPLQRHNCWVCPAWHPSFVVRQENGFSGKRNEVRVVIWNRHIKSIGELHGRPWQKVPNYKEQVGIVLSPEKAALWIRDVIRRGGRAAFDYETNMLKPDWPDARIVCASICWEGKETVAFPWHGAVIPAMREFVQSDIWKIASNLKFEDRWTNKILGVRVRRWFHDTMNCAHVHDNRESISGLKFQSFVWLGQESYDDHIKDLLRSKKDDRVNQVLKEVDLMQLLLYCGLDSVLEFFLAEKQRKALGYKW